MRLSASSCFCDLLFNFIFTFSFGFHTCISFSKPEYTGNKGRTCKLHTERLVSSVHPSSSAIKTSRKKCNHKGSAEARDPCFYRLIKSEESSISTNLEKTLRGTGSVQIWPSDTVLASQLRLVSCVLVQYAWNVLTFTYWVPSSVSLLQGPPNSLEFFQSFGW